MHLRFNEDFAYVPTKDAAVPLPVLQSAHAIFIVHASQLCFLLSDINTAKIRIRAKFTTLAFPKNFHFHSHITSLFLNIPFSLLK